MYTAAKCFLHLADAFHDNLLFGGVDGEDGALFSFVVSRNDDDFVAGLHVGFNFHGSGKKIGV
jgi:hypothetical protein